MDYEKKYKEIVGDIKDFLDHIDENYLCTYMTKDDIRNLYSRYFPELEMSENEKHIKNLHALLKEMENGPFSEDIKWMYDRIDRLKDKSPIDRIDSQVYIKGKIQVKECEELSDFEKIFDDIAAGYAYRKYQSGYNEPWYVKERASEMLHHAKKEFIKQGLIDPNKVN